MSTHATGICELLTNEQMAAADRAAVTAGVPYLTLMENAGRAVADEAARMVQPGARIAILCGPGNNGGDGFVAGRYLMQQGHPVCLVLIADGSTLKGDAATMAGRFQGVVHGPGSCREICSEWADIIIDAIFGAGLSRPIVGIAADVVAAANASGKPVLSVDVPSGCNGTTGQIEGPAIMAARTVTFFRRKQGHLLLPARRCCGQVEVADIGIPASALQDIRPQTFANAPALWQGAFPFLQAEAHKYTRGHAIVVSGGPETTGAARLGARGALRAGAGLVTVASPRAAFPVNAAHLTAIMVTPFEVPGGLDKVLADRRRNAVLVGPGCGVGTATREMVAISLRSGAAVVLDADALTSFADDGSAASAEPEAGVGSFGFLARTESSSTPKPADLFALVREPIPPDKSRRPDGDPGASASPGVVLTPHEGEFKRLFGELPGSKLDRARAAAKLSGAIVVLKGPDTVIAAPDGRAAINENAPPWLATAGSGDVLAGFATGLLAQGMPPFEAACAAVWLHGECANAFGRGLIAEDLPEALPKVLQRLKGDDRG